MKEHDRSLKAILMGGIIFVEWNLNNACKLARWHLEEMVFSGRGSNMLISWEERPWEHLELKEIQCGWGLVEKGEWWELRLQRMIGATPCSASWVMMKLLKGIKWGGIKKYFGCVALNGPAWPLVEGGREMKGRNSQFKWNFGIICNLCLLIFTH